MRSYGHQIENRVFWRGYDGYEPDTLRAWASLSARARGVLDIGANTGLFSLVAGAASMGRAEIHAFEPLSRIAEKTRSNADLNSHLRIRVHEVAVTDRSGEVTIFDPGGDHNYSASLDSSFLDLRPIDGRRVRGLTVDDFVRESGMSYVDLVKIDVEGCEDRVLRGAESTISNHRPRVVMELLPNASTEIMEAIRALLGRGYRLQRIGDGGRLIDTEMLQLREFAVSQRNIVLHPFPGL